MTKTEYLARVNGIWQVNGMVTVKGHSARIGGATELLLRGVNPDVVAQQVLAEDPNNLAVVYKPGVWGKSDSTGVAGHAGLREKNMDYQISQSRQKEMWAGGEPNEVRLFGLDPRSKPLDGLVELVFAARLESSLSYRK